jgi:hypothetical protein
MLETILAVALIIAVVALIHQNVALEDAKEQIAKFDADKDGRIGGSRPKPRLVK